LGNDFKDVERKKLLKENFVVSEQGFYVYKGGIKAKVPIAPHLFCLCHICAILGLKIMENRGILLNTKSF